MLNVLQTPLAGVQSGFGYTAFRDVLLDSDKVGDHSSSLRTGVIDILSV
jgi:hypothetical protein